MRTFPRLHIFLGAGGVGKTTLSAAYALSLANSGRKVGLLSIDPAKRLQTALGVRLQEEGVKIPISNHKGCLRASMLQLDQTLLRWIEQKKISAEKKEKLLQNPYYTALSEKLATSMDTLAAVRMAEWVEQYPDVEDLIIDTAPGFHAIDFIVKPEKVSLFLDSKLVEWLKIFVGDPQKNKQTFISRFIKTGAKKILEGLAFIGGQNFLVNFGEFLILLDDVFLTALDRLKFSRQWIFDSSTKIVVVTSVREDAVSMAKQFIRILTEMKLNPAYAIVNRTISPILAQEPAFLKFMNSPKAKNSCEALFANYFSSYNSTQVKVQNELEKVVNNVIGIPDSINLDKKNELRLSDLSSLGNLIKQQLEK